MGGEDAPRGARPWAGRAQLIQTGQTLQGHIETLLWIHTLSAFMPTQIQIYTPAHLTKKSEFDTESMQRMKWEKQIVFKDPMKYFFFPTLAYPI